MPVKSVIKDKVAPEELYLEAATLYRDDPERFARIQAENDAVFWVQDIGMQNEKGDPIEFKDHAPLQQVYNEMHPTQVYTKGSQIGLTQASINKLLWLTNHKNLTVLYTMPTADDVYKFSQSRFEPIVNSNDYLRGIMGDVNNASYKSVTSAKGRSHIFFRGAQKDTQAISIPVDLLVHDEFDFSNLDIIDTFKKRLGASKLGWRWYFSTPTIPDVGIDGLFKQSDQHHWLVKCGSCNRYQTLEFERNIFSTKSKGFYYGCWKCKRALNRRAGIWVAKFPTKATDVVFDKQGEIKKNATGIRGYFVNPLAFTFRSASQTMQAWDEAEKSGRNKSKQNFQQFDLGRAYVYGSDLITEKVIREHMTLDWNREGYNVLGCDQGDILHWVIKHIGPGGSKPIIAFGQATSFDEVATIFTSFECRAGIIDALPNKHNARKFAQDFPGRIYIAYYKDQGPAKSERIEEKRDPKRIYSQNQKETYALNIDRTESLDTAADDWVRGIAYLANNRTDQSDKVREFVRQMCNMKRVEEEDDKTAIVKANWVKTGDDHYRHADNYATVAAGLRSRGGADDMWVGGSITSDFLDFTDHEKFDMKLLEPPKMEIGW